MAKRVVLGRDLSLVWDPVRTLRGETRYGGR